MCSCLRLLQLPVQSVSKSIDRLWCCAASGKVLAFFSEGDILDGVFGDSHPVSAAAPSDDTLLVLTAACSVYSVTLSAGKVAPVPAMSRKGAIGRAIACHESQAVVAVAYGGADNASTASNGAAQLVAEAAGNSFVQPAVAFFDVSRRRPRATATLPGGAMPAQAISRHSVGHAGGWHLSFSPTGACTVVCAPHAGVHVRLSRGGSAVSLPGQASSTDLPDRSTPIASLTWVSEQQALALRADGAAQLADFSAVSAGSCVARVSPLNWGVEPGSCAASCAAEAVREGGALGSTALQRALTVVEPEWADASSTATVRSTPAIWANRPSGSACSGMIGPPVDKSLPPCCVAVAAI